MKRLTLWQLPQKTLLSAVIAFTFGTLNAQLPVITSFTPASGPVGTTVTITGTNFSSTPADNIVWFGAVRAVVTAASTVELTVIVPDGTTYQPVSVTVNGLTAYTSMPFNVTFSSTRIIESTTLASKIDFPGGTEPYSGAVSDLDGDGKPDLVMVNRESNNVSILRNRTDMLPWSGSSFEEKWNLETGDYPTSVAIDDIDGDGKKDIIVANHVSNTVSVFRNTSTPGSFNLGSFATRMDFTAGGNPRFVATGDIDVDGKPDILVTNFGTNTVSVLRNTSSPGTIDAGSFAAKVDFGTGNDPRAVVIGDIDSDGKPDIVVTNYNDNTISIFRNTSILGSIDAGSFDARVNFTTGMNPYSAVIGDIDMDNKPDLIISSVSDNLISIFRNTCTSGPLTAGSFADRVNFTTGAHPFSISIGDLDGDSKPDLVVTNLFSNTISLFRNTCTAGSITTSSLAGRNDFSTWTYPGYGAIGDLDGDSKPDIMVLNTNSNVVSVFRNTIPEPVPPVISSFAPSSGPVGTTMTITGMNFDITAANNSVWFGAVKATVTNCTQTQLTVTVPAGSTYRPITVTDITTGLTAYSKAPFTTTFLSVRDIDPSSFATNVNLTTGTNPGFVSSADLDVDGKPDLAVISLNSTLSIFRNNSTSGTILAGSFDPRIDLTAGSNPSSIAIGDIDGDDRPDIVVSSVSGNKISIFRNISTPGSLGTASFAPKVDFSTGSGPASVAIQDVDLDGRPEITVVNQDDNSVSVFHNESTPGIITTGSFPSRVDFPTGNLPNCVKVVDIDGDSKPDLIVSSSSGVSVYKNSCISGSITNSSFGNWLDISLSASLDIEISDIDLDGKPDLITVNNDNTVSVLRNVTTGNPVTNISFTPETKFASGSGPVSVCAGDINGDSKPDLLIANTGDNTVSILRNTVLQGIIDSGSFSARFDLPSGSGPFDAMISDIDCDGKPEITVSNNSGSTMSIIRNVMTAPIPPVINSLTPESGPVGTTMTISGSGFSTNLSDNYVWFGPVKATVTAATESQLTVTVPAGAAYHPITVTVNGMTASSGLPFVPTFAGTSEIETSAYSSQIDLPVGMFPSSFAAGDIDEDGKPDLFITNINSSSISVFRNTNTAGSISSGLFGPRVDIMSGTNPQGIVTADIDGDGKLDLVVANGTTSSSVSIFRNNGTTGSVTGGSFDPRVDLQTGDSSIDVAVGDIDGDGKPDLVVTNFNSTFISIYRNISTPGSITAGSFAPVVNFPAELYLQNIVLADIDGDKKPDLIAPRIYSSAVSVYRNISTMGFITTGSFAPKVDFITGMNPTGFAVGDLDNDGKPEIVVANNMDNNLSVLHNISSPGSITSDSFEPRTDFVTGGLSFVSIGDINGDGKPDLIYKSSGNSVNVMKNNCTTGSIGSGSFSSAVVFETSGGTAKTLLADFDCDGKPDIAYINAANNQVSILRNKISELSAPEITSFSPTSGPAGTIVTISGSNFSTNGGENIVRFGGIQATILSATTTTLTVVVPAVSSDQTISVTVNGLTATSAGTFTVTQPSQPPVIASFSPVQGTAGTTVTIDGANFSTTASENVVWFGAVKASVSSATSTRLTVTVPAGATYKPINVTVNGFTAYARAPFNVTFSSTQIIDAASFSAKVDLNHQYSREPALADLDGDGRPDLIVVNYDQNSVSVFRNMSSQGTITTGSFAPAVDFPTGIKPLNLAIGDIDGDGKLDLAVSNSSNSISILINTSTTGAITTGSFGSKVDLSSGGYTKDVEIYDLDGDGKSDLVASVDNVVSVFRNTSSSGTITTGSFENRIEYITGNDPSGIEVGDIDGDRKPDIIVANNGDNTVSVLRNTSSPGSLNVSSFAAKVDFTVGTTQYGAIKAALCDIDGDNKNDISVITGENSVSVFRNTSIPGSFNGSSLAARVELATGTNPYGISFGDIDGDGKPDMVVSINSGDIISVFRNASTPGSITIASFDPRFDFSGNVSQIGVAVGDIDGDSKPDIVTAGSRLVVLRNTMPLPLPPSITSFSPASGPVGSQVIIVGGNFSQYPEDNIVMFGDAQATVIEASQDQLTVLVPSGADGQSISVTVFGQTAYLDVSFTVTFSQEIELESSILTLNGDGINEHFVVKNAQAYGSCRFYVYNSRGALVYWNDNFQGEWDVTLHNKRFDTGGYFYIIETSIGTFRGSFSILRE